MQPNTHNREKSEEEFFEDIFVKFVLPIWRIESEIWKWRRENIQTNFASCQFASPNQLVTSYFPAKYPEFIGKIFAPEAKP